MRSADTHFFGGDDVHDVVSCEYAGKVGREGAGGGHVEFSAGAEGSEDEEAKVAEGVTVLVFFLAKEGAGTNAFDKKLKAFIHCINVGCGDDEEVGDRKKAGDVAKGLVRAFDKVSHLGVEEGVLHRELVFVMLLGGVWGEECKAVVGAGGALDIVNWFVVVEDGDNVDDEGEG